MRVLVRAGVGDRLRRMAERTRGEQRSLLDGDHDIVGLPLEVLRKLKGHLVRVQG